MLHCFPNLCFLVSYVSKASSFASVCERTGRWRAADVLLQQLLFCRSPDSFWLLPLPCAYRDETLLHWVCRAILGSRFKLLQFIERHLVLCKPACHRWSECHDNCPAHAVRLHDTVAGCNSTACFIQKDGLDNLKVPLAFKNKKKVDVFALICNSWGCSLWVQCRRYGFKLKCCRYLAWPCCGGAFAPVPTGSAHLYALGVLMN